MPFLTFSFLALALFGGAAQGGASGQDSDTLQDRRNLALTLESPDRHFVLYEPVIVTYEVSNPTSRVIYANVVMIQAAGRMEFLITDQVGRDVEYYGRGSLSMVANETVHQPGSVMSGEARLDWQGGTSAFPGPGTYSVRARMEVGTAREHSSLESNTVQIAVTEPTTVDAEAIRWFTSKNEFVRLLRDGAGKYCSDIRGPQCLERIRSFYQGYSSSVYAPEMAFELAEEVAHAGIDVPQKYDTSIGLLREFLDRWPNHPLVPRVIDELARNPGETGRAEEANQLLGRLRARYPEKKDLSDALAHALERLNSKNR